ncbi:MAG TPA: ABC transporter permease [Coriobacteriia bacterium]|jgi:ABC-2 type transport system permease protein
MKGFGAFLRKEALETARTWRIWVLPIMLVFFGVTSPLFAKLTPLLLKSIGTGDSDIVVQLTKPVTYADSYAQWIKNLAQVVLFTVIIASSGMISAEKRAGTAILVLTKPVSRAGFVVAKIVSNLALLAVAVTLGAVVCWAGTLALFGDAPAAPLAYGTLLWFVYAALVVSVMALFSALLDGQAGAAGAGIGFYALTSTLSAWPTATAFNPAVLVGAAAAAMAGHAVVPVGPLLIGSLLVVGCASGAVWAFEEREL